VSLTCYVVDPIRELACERSRVEQLGDEVARVEVQAEAVAPPECFQRFLGCDEVIGDLGWMHFQPEAHTFAVEDVENRSEALGNLVVATFDGGKVVRRERVEQMPDRRAGEPVDLRYAECRRCAGCIGETLGGAASHALGVTVAPDLRRQDAAVPLVDRVAYGLADEVRSESPAAETGLVE
jgi:hypothetical protein